MELESHIIFPKWVSRLQVSEGFIHSNNKAGQLQNSRRPFRMCKWLFLCDKYYTKLFIVKILFTFVSQTIIYLSQVMSHESINNSILFQSNY